MQERQRPSSIPSANGGIDARTALLRSRLRAISTLVTAALFLWLLRTPFALGHGHIGVQLGALAALGSLAILLWSRRPLSESALRIVEAGLLAVTTLRIVTWSALMLRDDLLAGREMLALGELYNSVFAIGALALLYGMLVPNVWYRALAMLVPLGIAPLLELGLLAWMEPTGFAFLRGLAGPEIGVNLLMATVVSVATATIGAHIVHSLQIQADEARSLGQYQLERRIAVGGMGEIWQARHRLLARPTAIKVIPPERIDPLDPAAAARVLHRFEQEARATAILESLHTVRVYDFGHTERGDFYYAMELLNGLDLEALVRRFGPLPPARAIYLLLQACDSLAEAHSHGHVHRDIKPSNLFVCQAGLAYDVVKVLDFGLVTRSGSEPTRDLRLGQEAEGLAGTPAYMAPEQVLAETVIDERADLYSLGCVAYWMLTGHTVFDVDRPIAMAVAHVKARPLPPSRRTEAEVPADLERIILRCLSKSPDERPRSAQELADRLHGCRDAAGWSEGAARAWWADHRPLESVLADDEPGPRTLVPSGLSAG